MSRFYIESHWKKILEVMDDIDAVVELLNQIPTCKHFDKMITRSKQPDVLYYHACQFWNATLHRHGEALFLLPAAGEVRTNRLY